MSLGASVRTAPSHTVERPRWLREHIQLNRVHSSHLDEHYQRYIHYVLPLHDETFECLARGFKLRETTSTFAEALERSSKDLPGCCSTPRHPRAHLQSAGRRNC